MSEGTTCYERDEILCEDPMCLRVGCRLRNDRLARSSAGSVELHRQHADDWRRQIISAGGDANVAEQAVTLAALNGLFDHINSTPIRRAAECARQAIEYSIDMGGADPAGVLLQTLNKLDIALSGSGAVAQDAPEPAPKTIMEAAASAADKISLWSNSKQGYANRIVPQPTQGGDKGEPTLWVCLVMPDEFPHPESAPEPRIRAWTTRRDRAEHFKQEGLDMKPLYAAPQPASNANSSQQSRLADRLTDVIAMLDTPDAYNRGYIAAVCRSILSSVSSTGGGPAA